MSQEALTSLLAALPEQAVLHAAREGARAALALQGLPTKRDEAWKYTRAQQLMGEAWRYASPSAEPVAALPEGVRLVWRDGHFDATASSGLPAGGQRLAVAGARALNVLPAGGFSALNLAWAQDGLCLDVAGGTDAGVVHLVHQASEAASPTLSALRHSVRVGARGRLQLVEHVRADGLGLRLGHHSTELVLEAGAVVQHTLVVHAPAGSKLLVQLGVALGAGASLDAQALVIGEGLVRRELLGQMLGEGAQMVARGLALGRGQGHLDQHLDVRMDAPKCRVEHQLRSVIDDASRGVQTTIVRVGSSGAGADVLQGAHAILLSEDGRVQGRPQLEIYTDDIAASHGATVGQLNEDALFYMRQRGLDSGAARRMLLGAFIHAALHTEAAWLADPIEAWLSGGRS